MPSHNETYPMQIANFDAWFSARLNAIAHAENEAEIGAAVEMIGAYCDAGWIHPGRNQQAAAVAAKRRKQLKTGAARRTADRMTGEAA